jgi:hypothetical protein
MMKKQASTPNLQRPTFNEFPAVPQQLVHREAARADGKTRSTQSKKVSLVTRRFTTEEAEITEALSSVLLCSLCCLCGEAVPDGFLTF